MPIKCTAITITQQLYQKNPQKINFLRCDSLGRILSLSCLIPDTNTLIIEDNMGLITGSLCERSMGCINIHCLYDTPSPNYDGIRRFNFTNDVKKCIHFLPLKFMINKNVDELITPIKDKDASEELIIKLKEKEEEKRKYYNNLLKIMNDGFDSIIISVETDPIPLTELLLQYLGPSKRFVIYCHFLDVLSNIHGSLYESGSFVNLQLFECFNRTIQVLPQRTHPEMNMENKSGYILSGVKVIKDVDEIELNKEKEMEMEMEINSDENKEKDNDEDKDKDKDIENNDKRKLDDKDNVEISKKIKIDNDNE